MNPPPEVILGALYFNGSLTLVIATIAYVRRRLVPASVPFALLMVAASWWSVSYAIMLSRPGVSAKVFWADLTYLAIVFIPVLWLIFALEYAGRQRLLTRRNVLLLLVIPICTLIIIWTNPLTGWFWRYVAPVARGGLSGLITEYGFWFFIHTLYSYLCLLAGTIILGGSLATGQANLYRGQVIALLIAVIAPWIGNAIYILQLIPGLSIDPTPFAFAVTGLSIAWAFYRYRLLELVPAAHDEVLNSMSDGVIVLDRNDNVIEANPSARQFVRLASPAAGQLVGRNMREVMAAWPDALERFGDASRVSTATIPLQVGAHTRYVDLRISPLRRNGKDVSGRVIVTSDVTAREAAAGLQKAREAAEAASQAKSAFLASMSHELRTPLNHIIGYSEILLEETAADGTDGQYGEDLQKIRGAGQHLLGIITQILELSRLEAGMATLQPDDFNLASLLEETAMAAQPLVEKNGNTLALDLLEADMPIHTDAAKLRQALMALLSNAARFTQDGRVALTARQRTVAAGSEQVLLEVSDTGPGIPPEQMDQLFTAFGTAEGAKRKKGENLGLGLATAWHLCRLMGGELSAASEVGVGSTFTITLPLEAAPQAKAE